MPGPDDRCGIGEVVLRLQPEFADVSLSKIRFLESAGLVTPARTAAGYRRFSEADIQRLRFVLAAQRDQHLPLKVIKEQLAGRETRLTREELIDAAGIGPALLERLESYALVRDRAGSYDGDALVIARTAGQLAAYGIDPRQLRGLRSAADRQIGMVEQAGPLEPDRVTAVVALAAGLQAALVRTGLRDRRGDRRGA